MSLKKPNCPFCNTEMSIIKDPGKRYVLLCGNSECNMIVRTKAHYKTMAALFSDIGETELAEQYTVVDNR